MKLLKDGTLCEDDIQAQFFAWLRCYYHVMPELRWIHHVPNGGTRSKREAARFKRMGVVKGVADVCVPISRGSLCGMYIEMKSAKGTQSDDQKLFEDHCVRNRYHYCLCRTAEEASQRLCEYLNTHMIVPMR